MLPLVCRDAAPAHGRTPAVAPAGVARTGFARAGVARAEVARAEVADTAGIWSARATRSGWLPHGAVTRTPSEGTARSVEVPCGGWAFGLLTGASGAPLLPPARAPWAA